MTLRNLKVYTNLLLTLFISMVLLSACGEKEHDVAYYVEHLDEAWVTLKECRNDARKDRANCKNAERAIMIGTKEQPMPRIRLD